MWIKSKAFEDHGTIPKLYTCDGGNLSPPLAWGDVPVGARSLAVLCDDPDAPGGTWRHWAAYNIPVQQDGLAQGAAAKPGLAQGLNDFRRVGYGGPCPPRGDGPHRYRFRLLALSRDKLPISARPSFKEVDEAAQASLLGEAVLVGIYAR